MRGQQPYMYEPEKTSRFPHKEFDPKAVTRASWEPKPMKPKKNGPLINEINRHPDLHEVPRSRHVFFRPMSNTSKWLIKWTRYLQILLRSVELIAALGLIALTILITGVKPLTLWVLRLTPSFAAACCIYSIWHHARPARARPPASSAAYQLFSGVTDCAVLPLYAYGMLAILHHDEPWGTLGGLEERLSFLVAVQYWTLLGAGALHVVSLLIAVYLGLMFKRIATLPPDMNPLESNLTARPMHKRNKSSVATNSTASDSVHRLSTPLEGKRSSGAPYEPLSRPPSIPFMHTRQNSADSLKSSNRDSRSDLPSRQYHVPFVNDSRNSVSSFSTAKTGRGNYSEIPLGETGSPRTRGRPESVTASPLQNQPINASPTRIAKFTESWYASDSLVARTHQRQRAMNAAEREQEQQKNHRQSAYEQLTNRYDNVLGDSDDENMSDRDHDMMRPDPMDDVSDYENDSADYRRNGGSPINAYARMSTQEPVHPLRAHPSSMLPKITNPNVTTKTPTKTPPRQKTPFSYTREVEDNALSEVSLNSRRVSGGVDIADAKRQSIGKRFSQKLMGSKNNSPRNRDSSIQPDIDFLSTAKSYGDLRAATPPVMLNVDNDKVGSANRQVSSGNDYDLGASSAGRGYRRHVSGKQAEEGMAGAQTYSRYSILRD